MRLSSFARMTSYRQVKRRKDKIQMRIKRNQSKQLHMEAGRFVIMVLNCEKRVLKIILRILGT